MPQTTRNSIEEDGWVFTKIDNFEILTEFNCGDDDLNEYFKQDAAAHRALLLTETYQFTESSTELPFPVALVSLCNDAIKKDEVKDHPFFQELPEKKRYPDFPAVKIARIGVHKAFHGNHIGKRMINLIKKMFITDNRTGCRFITVDAYNALGGRDDRVIKFYQNCDFQFLYNKDFNRPTRSMFFDLKRLCLVL